MDGAYLDMNLGDSKVSSSPEGFVRRKKQMRRKRPSSLTRMDSWQKCFVLLSLSILVHTRDVASFSTIHLDTLRSKHIDWNVDNHRRHFGILGRTRTLQMAERKESPSLLRRSKEPISMPTDATSMDTALCIIPPGEAWDKIQKARHFARDPTFFQWPPAIRLFHPFSPRDELQEVGLSIAQIIESCELESFDITLNQISIVPHHEVLEEMNDAQETLPVQAKQSDQPKSQESIEVEELIEMEELKGKRKLARRLQNEAYRKEKKEAAGHEQALQQKAEEAITPAPEKENLVTDVNATTTVKRRPRKLSENQISPRDRLSEQKKAKQLFNGPCVICLEPDDESKLHIQAFREILRKRGLGDYDPFSVSSSLTSGGNSLPRKVLDHHGLLSESSSFSKGNRYENSSVGSTFRPVLTLGRFESVSKAVRVAKALQEDWEPLTFRVTDLQIISEGDSTIHGDVYYGNDSLNKSETNTSRNSAYGIDLDEDGVPIMPKNRELAVRNKLHGTDESESLVTRRDVFGCDAMIMLYGEEESLFNSSLSSTGVADGDGSKSDDGHDEIDRGFNMAKEDEDQIMELLMSAAASEGGIMGTSDVDDSFSIDGTEYSGSSIESGEDDDRMSDYLEDLLDDDGDVDEGTTVIIGRTQFFTGELRQYADLPASSAMDGKAWNWGI